MVQKILDEGERDPKLIAEEVRGEARQEPRTRRCEFLPVPASSDGRCQ